MVQLARTRKKTDSRETDAATPMARAGLHHYWDATPLPLYNLLFVLPLVVFYELGVIVQGDSHLVAQKLLQVVVGWVGVSVQWGPGLVVLATLAVWHVATRRPWRVRLSYLPLMAAESVVLTLPLFAIHVALMSAQTTSQASVASQVVAYIGAGIFEELVFRLALLTGVVVFLQKICQVPRRWSLATAIVISSLLFAYSHFQPVGHAFNWPEFLHFTLGGAYFAAVFLGRGVGIAIGCHAAYDLISIL